jgi:thiamine pyrophosphokinase
LVFFILKSGSHQIGTKQHEAAKNYILLNLEKILKNNITKYKFDLEEQPFTYKNFKPVSNILVRIYDPKINPDTDSVLINSHYDTRFPAPGIFTFKFRRWFVLF